MLGVLELSLNPPKNDLTFKINIEFEMIIIEF